LPSVQASEEFEVNAPPDKCWEFFSDLSNVGNCIPGCENVQNIDGSSAIFKVKLKVGYLSKTFELKARVIEKIEGTRMKFTGEGRDAEVTGSVDLSVYSNKTKIRYSVEIKPISVTGKTAVTMLGKDLVKKQASEFAACVKSRLEVV
jgi:uncharacterized protein